MFKKWDNVRVQGVEHGGLVVDVIKRVSGEPVYIVAIGKTAEEFACDASELQIAVYDED